MMINYVHISVPNFEGWGSGWQPCYSDLLNVKFVSEVNNVANILFFRNSESNSNSKHTKNNTYNMSGLWYIDITRVKNKLEILNNLYYDKW